MQNQLEQANIPTRIEQVQARARVRLLDSQNATKYFYQLQAKAQKVVRALGANPNTVKIMITSAKHVANSYKGRPECTVILGNLNGVTTIARVYQVSAHITRGGARIPCALRTPEVLAKAKELGLVIHAGDIVLAE
jgi:hypothetical protein